MSTSLAAVAVGTLVFVVSMQGTVWAGPTPQKCEAGKLKVTGRARCAT